MTKKSTSEQAEMNAHEVAKFERIACGGIYEMVSTLHGLPPADGLDETDVRTAVACACLRSFRRENRPSRASRSLDLDHPRDLNSRSSGSTAPRSRFLTRRGCWPDIEQIAAQ